VTRIIFELPEPSEAIEDLFSNRAFIKDIRKYNSSMSFTSFGTNAIRFPNGVSNYRIQGQVYHRMGSLLPETHDPLFGQLYFYDSETQLTSRMNQNGGLDPIILRSLQAIMDRSNPIFQKFKSIVDSNVANVDIVLRSGEKNYSAPTGSEIAVLLPNEGYSSRNIVIKRQSNDLHQDSGLREEIWSE
jgi:hypothetical protein